MLNIFSFVYNPFSNGHFSPCAHVTARLQRGSMRPVALRHSSAWISEEQLEGGKPVPCALVEGDLKAGRLVLATISQTIVLLFPASGRFSSSTESFITDGFF